MQLAVLGGLDSAINFDAAGPGTADAVGGYFNGLFADNYARAYIDDRANVGAARDVTLESRTTNNLLSVVEAGGEAEDVGINGAGSLVMLGQESLAYIEDRADVTRRPRRDARRRQRRRDRQHAPAASPRARTSASACPARSRSMGEARALDEGGADEEELDGFSKTHAFIGDSLAPVGPLGTGGETGTVIAGDDILLDAEQQPWRPGRSRSPGEAIDRSVPAGSARPSSPAASRSASASPATWRSTSSTTASQSLHPRRRRSRLPADLISLEANDTPDARRGRRRGRVRRPHRHRRLARVQRPGRDHPRLHAGRRRCARRHLVDRCATRSTA